MTPTLGIALTLALSALPVAEQPLKSLVFADANPGQAFEIRTTDRIFRGQLVDPATGECRLAEAPLGGQFSAPAPMFLLGSTHGSHAGSGGLSLVMMHQVKVGMRMELERADLRHQDRTITSPVVSIRLLPGDAQAPKALAANTH